MPIRFLLLVMLAVSGLPAMAADTGADPAVAGGGDSFGEQRGQLDRAQAARLAQLAAKCDELRLAEQAQQTRARLVPRDPARQYLFLPPDADPLQPAADAPTIVQQWYQRFRQLRREHAAALFQLARQQLDTGHATRAYQLLHEVLDEDPDHAAARQILGYRQVSGRWRKPEGTVRARRLNVAQPSLGFSAGQCWLVESEHFTITTNHSQEAGERLAARLELLYDVWQQVFFPCWSTAAALAHRFADKPAAARGGGRHKVVLFRDRQQYLEQLRRLEPKIELSVAFYSEQTKTAYVYGAADTAEANVLHEVTHQLFAEAGRALPPGPAEAHYWIVEGVALYMESLQPWAGCATVGGLDANWLQYARYRALSEQFYVPLAKLVTLGRQAFQQHPKLKELYAQAAGLTAFLMDSPQGRYREALLSYLQAVYQGRPRPDALATLVGGDLARLDAEYHAFLNVRDADLAYLALLPTARKLLLGHTQITDAGLAHLAGLHQLEWLDLGFTKTTDAGLRHLREAPRLTQLNLEQTAITDAALDTIGRFRALESLDLSGTRLSDAGLAPLAGLSQLKELWLTGTPISDAGLRHLRGLKQLEMLDLNQTQVTAESWKQLQADLPKLQPQ